MAEQRKKHPFIAVMDVLIFAFVLSELSEEMFHVGLRLILPEASLQLVMLVLRTAAVWHAGRHL